MNLSPKGRSDISIMWTRCPHNGIMVGPLHVPQYSMAENIDLLLVGISTTISYIEVKIKIKEKRKKKGKKKRKVRFIDIYLLELMPFQVPAVSLYMYDGYIYTICFALI
jgi:hypothetical protein